MSAELQWILTRNYNSFQVKRLREGPVFTTEPGNLTNIVSYKHSGLIQPSIDISTSKEGSLVVKTRKPSASPNAVKGATVTSGVRARSGPRRASKSVTAYPRKGYRPDLSKAALARTSALVASQRPKKAAPEKKTRGKKAKVAAASA